MNREATWQVITTLSQELDMARINQAFWDDTALFVQGVDMPELAEVTVNVQWDQFQDAQQLFAGYGISEVEKEPGYATFTFERDGMQVRVVCFYNTVVAADKERVAVVHDGQTLYAKSAMHTRRLLPESDPRVERINVALRGQQRELSEHNALAWGHDDAYKAWVARFGTPVEAAERIRKHPAGRLKELVPFIGDVKGKKVVNLLGSHGSRAVALALLGAEATVVDISPSNAAYAEELAAAAGVPLRYVVSDLLELPQEELTGDYDLAVMENGILHYFVDLLPVAKIIAGLLRSGGRLVLQDFHPISTKLITSKGKKHKVAGDYFDMSLQESNVAYSVVLEDAPHKVLLRKWTLGEIVTALADAGLMIRTLSEDPNTKLDDKGLPKTYTIVAEKL